MPLWLVGSRDKRRKLENLERDLVYMNSHENTITSIYVRVKKKVDLKQWF